MATPLPLLLNPQRNPSGPKNLRNFLRRTRQGLLMIFTFHLWVIIAVGAGCCCDIIAWLSRGMAKKGQGGGVETGRESTDFGPWPSQVKCQKSENSLCVYLGLFLCFVVSFSIFVCMRTYGCRLSRIYFFLAIQFQVARCLFIVGLQQPPQPQPHPHPQHPAPSSSCCHNKKPHHHS